jgi:hypothetical protein
MRRPLQLKRNGVQLCSLLLFTALAAQGRLAPRVCGTEPTTTEEALFLHRQSRLHLARRAATAPTRPPVVRTVGDIAIVGESPTVVARRNPFDLDRQTLLFTPQENGYRLNVAAADTAALMSGETLAGLDDDDSREVPLPFPFRYYGVRYQSVFVNSDGNLTFGLGDSASTDRSVSRMLAGPPRISPAFLDLDPSRAAQRVMVFSDSARFSVIWREVPIYSSTGFGQRQSFQVTLYPDGRIEFLYAGMNMLAEEAVVGIAPGRSLAVALRDLTASDSFVFPDALIERFASSESVDVAAATSEFYRAQDDAYDFLFVFNSINIPTGNGAIAYELTVRNQVTGYGFPVREQGPEFGSPQRLQAVMYMGPILQYPADPFAPFPGRPGTNETTISILGHEAGHRFLAYASITEQGRAVMLGRDGAHWAFNFNSEASLVEGNRIQDQGASANPRFRTTAAAEGYGPLDQYFFGFRGVEEVPPTFVVLNSTGPDSSSAPRPGVAFNGTRRDIAIDELVALLGPRLPDAGIAQRRFRFGFVIVGDSEGQVPAPQLARVERLRQEWTDYWSRVTDGRSEAEVTLKRALSWSLAPSATLASGVTQVVTASVARPVAEDLTLVLAWSDSIVSAPENVVIPAGDTSVQFEVRTTGQGLVEGRLVPVDSSYAAAVTRLRVLPAP